MQETLVWFLVRKTHWRRDGLPTPVFLGFPCGSAGKESACNVEDLGSIPGLGISPGEGKGYPLQYSGLENSMNCQWDCRVRHDWSDLAAALLYMNFEFIVYFNFTKYLIAWIYFIHGASLVAQLIKNPPAMWETWVQSLGWEYPLEKGKATHYSILACSVPWTV